MTPESAILTTKLNGFVDAGRFTGRYDGPVRGAIEESFEQNLARIFARAETPRLSGVQIKAPMHLTPDGTLLPAIDLPFTHILKPAGTAAEVLIARLLTDRNAWGCAFV